MFLKVLALTLLFPNWPLDLTLGRNLCLAKTKLLYCLLCGLTSKRIGGKPDAKATCSCWRMPHARGIGYDKLPGLVSIGEAVWGVMELELTGI